MAYRSGPNIAKGRKAACPGSGKDASGSAISATPPSPHRSPSPRSKDSRSCPSMSAIGKASSGTVEIRSDMTPAGSRSTEVQKVIPGRTEPSSATTRAKTRVCRVSTGGVRLNAMASPMSTTPSTNCQNRRPKG